MAINSFPKGTQMLSTSSQWASKTCHPAAEEYDEANSPTISATEEPVTHGYAENQHYETDRSVSVQESKELFDNIINTLLDYRRFFEDCFTYHDDINFKVLEKKKFSNIEANYRDFLASGKGDNFDAKVDGIVRLNVVLRVRDHGGKVWLVLPSVYAWTQILDALGFPKLLFNTLIDKNNPHLLVENLNFLINSMMKQKNFLLRMVSFSDKDLVGKRSDDENARPLLLRAFLQAKFCRMDGVYLCKALHKALDKLFINSEKAAIGNVHCSLEASGGDLLIDVEFVGKKKLTMLNEEFLTGIRLRASEIGRYKHITISPVVKRLVCLNGMTAVSKKGETRISYYDARRGLDMTPYPHLPPYPMEGGRETPQELINALILRVVTNAVSGCESAIKKFEFRANRFIKDAKDAKDEKGEELTFNKNDIRAALALILKKTGLNTLGGVSTADILSFYYAEAEYYAKSEEHISKKPPNIAWLLLNAITRYATHHVMLYSPDLAQAIQERIYSHLLNPQCITWSNIKEHVYENRRKTSNIDEEGIPV